MPAARTAGYHRTHGSESVVNLNAPLPQSEQDTEFHPLNRGEDLYYGDDRPRVTRTPSPSPSEVEFVEKNNRTVWTKFKGIFTWKWIRGNVWTIVLVLVMIAFIVLSMLFQSKIITALIPPATKLAQMKYSWAIGIAIVALWCFPPLFLQEVLQLIAGIVWGLKTGMIVVAVGTMIGETLCYLVFRYGCTARMKKLESKSIWLDCLSRVVNKGGFAVALLVRLSTIPPHYSTALFATCGLKFWSFLAASLLSLPKQLIGVWSGYLYRQAGTNKSEQAKDNLLTTGVQVLAAVMCFVAMEVIRRRINKVTPEVIYERRKARQGKQLASNYEEDQRYPPLRSEGGSRVSLDTPFDPYDKNTTPTLYDPVPVRPLPGRASPVVTPPAEPSTEKSGQRAYHYNKARDSNV